MVRDRTHDRNNHMQIFLSIQERCEQLVEIHGSQRKAAKAVGISAPLFSYLRRGIHEYAKDETLAKLGIRRIYVLDE